MNNKLVFFLQKLDCWLLDKKINGFQIRRTNKHLDQ